MLHTQGPWEIERTDEEGLDGVTIVSREGPVAFRVIDCSADLIVAAPELLAALKGMVGKFGWVLHSWLEEPGQSEVRAALVAINKAEGNFGN